MGFVVTFVCTAAMQQLHLEPYPGEVGQPVTVTASRDGSALAGLAVAVELPDGTARAIGLTDAEGCGQFVPEAVGSYVYSAVVGGVRILAPHRVVAPRRRWWLALGTMPLGLALLWQISRARGRRAP